MTHSGQIHVSEGSEARTVAAQELPLISEEKSIEFLLAEHSRIARRFESSVDSYHRRFDVWLAVFSAGFLGVITIIDKIAAPLRDTLVLLVVAGLLVLGVSVFQSLATASVTQVHSERAIRRIQRCFARRDPPLDAYLYRSKTWIVGADFGSLVLRGLAGGGLKAILVIANSAAVTVLVLAAPGRFGLVYTISPIIIGAAVFVASSAAHVAYTNLYYALNGIGDSRLLRWVSQPVKRKAA